MPEKVACMAQHLGARRSQRDAVCLAAYGELNPEGAFEVSERLRQPRLRDVQLARPRSLRVPASAMATK